MFGNLFRRSHPVAAPRSHRVDANYPYHAVAIKCGMHCCKAARVAENKRVLSVTAPTLPVAACTMPNECTCHFQKFNDRRQEHRRIFGSSEDSRYFGGTERRQSGGRRAADRR